jgi:hypothetical protein
MSTVQFGTSGGMFGRSFAPLFGVLRLALNKFFPVRQFGNSGNSNE